MADDVTVDNGALTDYTVSADDASGKLVQRVKLAYSADGVATHVTADADGLLVNLGANNDVTVTGTVTASGPLTDTQLRATAVPVSLATVPSHAVTGTFFQATQPVSAASLPLPSGAATAALQAGGLPAALGSGGGLKVDGSGTALPVTGTITAVTALTNALPAGTNAIGKLAANDGVDIGDVTVNGMPGTATNAAAQVTVTNASTTIVSARATRRSLLLVNQQTVAVYIDPSGGTAATTHFRLDPGAAVVLETVAAVTGITSAAYTASGDAKVHYIEQF